MLIEVLVALVTLIVVFMLYRKTCRGPLQHLSPAQRQLFQAVSQQDIDQVRMLISQDHVDVNTKTYAGMNALFFAVEKGDARLAQLLIDSGIEVGRRADNGDTPLRRAVYRNHIEVAKVLIAAQADLNESYRDKMTPLLVAVGRNSRALVGLLLQHNADVRVFEQTAGSNLLSKASEDIQALVLRYRAWSDSKKVLFVYRQTRGGKPNLPEDLLQVVVSFLISQEGS